MKETRRTYDVRTNEFKDLVRYIKQKGFTSDKPIPNLVDNHNNIFDGDAPVGDFDYQVLCSPKERIEDFSEDLITGIALHVQTNTRLDQAINKYLRTLPEDTKTKSRK